MFNEKVRTVKTCKLRIMEVKFPWSTYKVSKNMTKKFKLLKWLIEVKKFIKTVSKFSGIRTSFSSKMVRERSEKLSELEPILGQKFHWAHNDHSLIYPVKMAQVKMPVAVARKCFGRYDYLRVPVNCSAGEEKSHLRKFACGRPLR